MSPWWWEEAEVGMQLLFSLPHTRLRSGRGASEIFNAQYIIKIPFTFRIHVGRLPRELRDTTVL